MNTQKTFCRLVAACALFGVAAFTAVAFELVNGSVTAEIVLPEAAEPSSRLAAKELSTYVEKISGQKLPIRLGQSQANNKIIIGSPATLPEVPTEIADKLKAMKENEAYGIMAKGNTLYIVGKNEVAELYGTYRFLEDKLGVRWLKTASQRDSGEYVPKSAVIAIPDYTEFRAPFFFKRALDQCGSRGDVVPVNSVEWANRNGYQTPVPYTQSYRYNPQKEWEKQRTEYYAPRIPRYAQQLGGTHLTFVAPFRPLKKTFDEHPEYFALMDGKRVMGEQICIGNPEVQRKLADFIIGKIKANGGGGEFTFGMVDVPTGWCECEKCKALDGKDPRANFTEVSTRFFNVVNRVSQMVFEVYPNADLRTWAYAAYRLIPYSVKLDPRLKVQFATHGRCWGHRLNDPDCSTNVAMYQRLKDWRKYHSGLLYTYEYFFCSQGYYDCVEEVLAHDLKLYSTMDVTGWKEQAYFEDSALLKLKDLRENLHPSNWQMLYMTGKLLWDPTLEPAKVLDEAESLYYGKAYPEMKKYHALRRKLWRESNVCIGYPRDNVQRTQTLLNIPGAKQKLLEYLAAAKKLAQGDATLTFRIGEDERWLREFWIKPNDRINSAAGKPYCSPGFKGKITIDGIGNEPAWRNAFYTNNFFEVLSNNGKNNKIPEALATSVGILSDSENLYFLITAMEPTPEKLTGCTGKDSKVYKGDCIELFLYPPTAENVYYQIAAGYNGAVFDAMQPGSKKEFDSGVEVQTKVLKDRYVIELRVPAAKLAKFIPGDQWKVHIARGRAIKDPLTNKPKDNSFFALDGVSHHNYTAYHPLIIGAMPEPEFRNGDFTQVRKNVVRAKQFSKQGRTLVDAMFPSYWGLIGKNDVLEMRLQDGSKNDYYAVLTAGTLFQVHFGKGQTYNISFRGKGAGAMRLDILLYDYGTDRSKLKFLRRERISKKIALTDDWKTYEFTVTKPNQSYAMGIALVHLDGTACIDDVTISRVAALQYHGQSTDKK